jgi:hypothetical protein
MGGQMKILVTGGCSFAELETGFVDTWPRHLENNLEFNKHISTGLGSIGNGLISRRVLYQVQKNLQHASDMIVGISWSGPNRAECYMNKPPDMGNQGTTKNPNCVVENYNNWVIMNVQWKHPVIQNYYTHFHDYTAQLVYSYEHILRVQWFLKQHKIKYFMTAYTDEVFPDGISQPEVKYLYDLIDHSMFLPVTGIYEWCRDFSNLEFPIKRDNHPSSQQHALFTSNVIIPFLKEKNYI